MIDSEYDHAADSIQNGTYVPSPSCRSRTTTSQRGLNARGWASIPNVSVDMPFQTTITLFSGRNSARLVGSVPVRPFGSSPAGPNSAACTGWSEGRTSTCPLGARPASTPLVIRCKHHCEEHVPTYPARCRKCSCSDFMGNFACLTCDGPW